MNDFQTIPDDSQIKDMKNEESKISDLVTEQKQASFIPFDQLLSILTKYHLSLQHKVTRGEFEQHVSAEGLDVKVAWNTYCNHFPKNKRLVRGEKKRSKSVRNQKNRSNKRRRRDEQSTAEHEGPKKKQKKASEDKADQSFASRKSLVQPDGRFFAVFDFANIVRADRGIFREDFAEALLNYLLRYSLSIEPHIVIQRGQTSPSVQKMQELGWVSWVSEKSPIDDEISLQIARERNGFIVVAENGDQYERPRQRLRGVDDAWLSFHRIPSAIRAGAFIPEFDMSNN